MKGTVYKSTGSWYSVKTQSGRMLQCRIKGKFRIQGIKSTNPVAVGDRVVFEYTDQEDHGVITEILERKNYIIRKSVNLSKQIQIIAANIDAAFLLITFNNPPTFPAFIDRFLVTAEAYHIEVILLFNKEDTYSENELKQIRLLKTIYENIGYTCLEISALHGTHVDQVKKLMGDKVCMLSGHSGVGKSTLINAMSPKLHLKTGEISDQHQQGQHTTTFAELYELDFGAKIIDTPGIRGFGVVDIEKNEIGNYFPDFFSIKNQCKFNNCLHVDEPFCAIKEAVKHNKIAASRYKSYLQMLQGEDVHYRTDFWDL